MSGTIRSETVRSEAIRAFLAFELPPGVTASLEELQGRLKGFDLKLRWVRAENIHLTVKFLGGVRRQDIDRIGEACTGALQEVKPFSLRAEEVGAFPGCARAKVVWAGLAGDTSELSRFAVRIEEALLPVGFAKEPRPFKAHLTLGRIKGRIDPGKLSEAIESVSGFVSESFILERLFLFKSDLTPSGAIYTRLREIHFGLESTGGKDDFISR